METSEPKPGDADLRAGAREAERKLRHLRMGASNLRLHVQNKILCETVGLLLEEVERLRAAIRAHREAKGHERCWLNNVKLYALLGESIEDPELPERAHFLERCAAYYDEETR